MKSFEDMCVWLEDCDNEVFTLEELRDKMAQFSDGGEVYSAKHLKRKLQERYGYHVYFTEVRGRKNVLC